MNIGREPSFFSNRFAVLLLIGPLMLFAIGCGKNRNPNILLITLDTTRADHLGCYGSLRETSPNLDRLAKDATVYTNAYTTSSWTLPSHASLFTGIFPTSHGAQYDPDGPLRLTSGIEGPKSWDNYRARGLSPQETTLADLLKSRGYATGSIVAGPWMKKVFGLDQGFDHYDDSGIDDVSGRRAESVTLAAIEWLEEQKDETNFLFLNYYDPHGPFDPPTNFRRVFLPDDLDPESLGKTELLNRLYDGEILYMDHHLGILFEALKRLGLDDKTLIIITADHGELMGENGAFGHGSSLSQAEIRVPLIVRDPRPEAPTGNNDTPVQVTGVLPMIAKRLGLTIPPRVQGMPLPEPSNTVFAEVYPLPVTGGLELQTIIQGEFKFTQNGSGELRLFQLSTDPTESKNVITRFPKRARDMERTLRRLLAGLPRPQQSDRHAIKVDEATQRALEGLGYIEKKPKTDE